MKTLFLVLLTAIHLHAETPYFPELFADPSTRSEALALLTPGTRQHFFHTALDHQLAGREKEYADTINAWRTASERKEKPLSRDGLDILENRRVISSYDKNPRAALAELKELLDFDLDATKPDSAAENLNLPTTLDPALVSENVFRKEAEKKRPDAPYAGYGEATLAAEMESVEKFPEEKIRWFTGNFTAYQHPRYTDLLAKALSLKTPYPTDRLRFDQLTLAQMDTLRAAVPRLAGSDKFNAAYLQKLAPAFPVELERHTPEHAAFLAKCATYVEDLPPSQNSLKAHILYHHLRLQELLGNFPKDDLLAYLALPRRDHSIILRTKESRFYPSDQDFTEITLCPRTGSDAKLIERLLSHFLATSETPDKELAGFLKEKPLIRLHARARLLSGADPKPLAPILGPEEYKSLRQETRVSFAHGAPEIFSSETEVTLPLDLKNTPELLVRIYEIASDKPSAAIDLDGLVPHHSRALTFPQAPIVLHREQIPLPELAGAGTWIVEFVSERVSARALIRKGNLTPYVTREAAGQFVRVFDEKSEALKNFTLTLGDEKFTAKNGTIVVPDSANQPVTSGKLEAGKLSTTLSLGSRGDDYELETDFLLDREQLLANQQTKLHLRTQLTNHGAAVPLTLVKNPVLVLKAGLLGGVTTERIIADPLELAVTNEIPFLVPADMTSLTLTLSGTIDSEITGEEKNLTATTTYHLNGALETSRIATALFSPTSTGHQLHLRGRNGEPLPQRPLKLVFTHNDYKEFVTLRLRTDNQGLINLGSLTGIKRITASSGDIAPTIYTPPTRDLSLPATFTITEHQEIRIPTKAKQGTRAFVRLSAKKTTVENLPLSFTKNESHLLIRALPPGDYLLTQNDNQTEITVLPAAAKKGNLLVTGDRILPLDNPTTPTIAEAETDGKNVLIRLNGISPETTLTVIAKRYVIPGWQAGYAPFPFEPAAKPSLTRSIRPSSYLTERLLSDEMRYILDRRAAKTFPGAMLPRPGQLLYRWTPDDLDQETQDGDNSSRGNNRPSLNEGGGFAPSPKRKSRARTNSESHPTVIDFLQHPSAVIVKEELPSGDESFTIEIPIADLQGAQFLQIIVANPQASDTTYLPLPPSETPLRDRRIARPLDPETHHLATRFAAALAPGAEAQIQNLLDADWRAFTTLEEAYQFLLATTGEDNLRDFDFLTKWPTLEEKEKLAILADHHCHELHLFLSRKDPDFFKKHILPFLTAKTEPQFIDDYLLNRDLETYLRPHAFAKLNAAEKALLAQALPARQPDISRELDLRWKTEAPSPDAQTILFTQTLKGSDLSPEDSLGLAKDRSRTHNVVTYGGDSDSPQYSIDDDHGMNSLTASGSSYIGEKLNRIIIPRIDFEDTTLEEALDFLRLRTQEMDSLELDPNHRGINMVVRRPRGTGNAESAESYEGGDLLGGGDPGNVRIDSLKLRNVPLGVALKYIGDATKMRYKIDDYAVTMVPQTETGEDLFTRTFRVPPDFISQLSGDSNAAENDPFADTGGNALYARPPISELLKRAGILLPEGASATLGVGGTLLVTNTPSELDKIEQLTATFGETESEVDAFMYTSGVLPPIDDLADFTPVLRFPDRTKLWLAANYYKHRRSTEEDPEDLIPLNRFWLELSAWDGKGPFTSPHFNACTTSSADALMCLAMLDLPFTADRPEVTVDGSTLKVKARAPMLLFYKDTRQTQNIAAESPLLVRQSYHPLAEPFQTDPQGRKIENTVTGDFRTGVPYGLSLVVTNPTGTERRIETLAQIPAGAIPLDASPETKSTAHQLEPYGVVQLNLAFYFPAAGDYTAYPFHVSEDGQILAHADAKILRVSADPAPEDSASWLVIARDGTNQAVLNRLSTENLSTIDLTAILWRAKDKEVFLKASEILHSRLADAPEFYLYGLLHDDPTTISDFLADYHLAENLGQWFTSKLITVTPTSHHGWETMEFDPLVNARAHPFGDHPRLTHQAAREHYQAFLETLAWKPALTSTDQLAFTYHLFLQDRIAEALARFEKITPADLPDTLQYDYLHALALFYQEKPGEAKAIATPYLAKLPPGLWRDRFLSVSSQAEEISKPIPDAPEEKSDTRPSLEMDRLADGKLLLKHSNLTATTLSLYNIDLEILFSKDPFLKGGVESSLPPIAPNRKIKVPFGKNSTETTYSLPAEFSQGNILIAAESTHTKQLKILDSRQLEARINPTERTIQVIDPETKTALPGTYVKIFAESRDGTVSFHKDGYTDLRGKFDYLSHTATDAATIRRLAILISHPTKGTRTLTVDR